MKWILSPDLQLKLRQVQDTTEKLKKELGISTSTIYSNDQDNVLVRSHRSVRPLPKWKV